MKKSVLSFCFLFCSLMTSAQAWDFLAWGLYAGLNAKYGEATEDVIKPYTYCLIGSEVTLQEPDFLFHKYDWKHEEGKKEIDRDEWTPYIGKRYVVTRVGFGAEAGFFQYGVVFELDHEGEKLYAVISNRRIMENDGLATIFKESVPCPDWYKTYIEFQQDPFTSEVFWYSKLARLTDDQQGFIAIGETILNDDKPRYELMLHLGSNKERIATDSICEFVFDDWSKMTFPTKIVEVEHLDKPYKFYYSLRLNLTQEQIDKFATSYVTAVRMDNIRVVDIRQSVGQRFMYIIQALLDIL